MGGWILDFGFRISDFRCQKTQGRTKVGDGQDKAWCLFGREGFLRFWG